EIKDFLGMPDDSLIFDYSDLNGKTKLDLITVNPRHNQSFLFHSCVGIDKPDALRKMVEYVKNTREEENIYTVQWMAQGDPEIHNSYFRAKNMYQALDKLYYGRDMNTINIFMVALNPIS